MSSRQSTRTRTDPTVPTSRARCVRGQPLARWLAGAAILLLLAGCGSARAASAPTWVPITTAPGIGLLTPTPPGPGGSGSSGSSTDPGQNQPTPGQTSNGDPYIVATKLTAPTGLAVLPDGTALVGERTTGRILLVQPVAGKPVTVVRTLTGLDTRGGGGLLDLALSGSYSDDQLILALITTATDTRLVHFTMTGPVTTVFAGIPRGPSDNGGRILAQQDGYIYIGTGDAGTPANATNPKSLAGKVLRIDDVGQPAPGNPLGGAVFTEGHHVVGGLCQDDTNGTLFEAEAGTSTPSVVGDELNILKPGASYGWPGGGGTAGQALGSALGGVGDCATVDGNLYLTGLGGQDLFQTPIDANGKIGALRPVLNKRYGRLLTVVAAPDGTLWLTTSNKDGHGTPTPADERVLHIPPVGDNGGSSSA